MYQKNQNMTSTVPESSHLVGGKYSIKDLIDIESLRKTLEKFSLATGFTTGFIEYPTQEILISTGWRDICTKYHRAFPESAKHCKESNIYLTEQLKKLKEFSIKPCENGLVDGATPIVIDGKYIAYLATGQVLFEKPDIERFKKQAEIYGYDADAYLEALSKVPVVSKEQFKNALSFLSELAVTICKTGLNNLELKEKTRELEEEVAERKQVELALRESEKRYRTLFDTCPQGILVADSETMEFVLANPAICRMLGYSQKELTQKGVADIHPKKDLPHVKSEFDAQVRGDKITATQIPCLRKDGSVLFADIISAPAPINSSNCNIGFFQDVTELKRAEAAVRESEEKFRELSDSLPQVVFETDDKGNLAFVNTNAFVFFGYTREDFDQGLNALEMIIPAERDSAMENIQRVLSGKILDAVEYTALRKDGSTFPVVIHSNPIIRDDRAVGLRGILIDLTEQKKLATQLRQAQKMEAIGTLAGGIAHDFNNILSAIIGYSEIAMMKVPDESDLQHDLTKILKAGDRAKDLVRQILTFSRQSEQELKPVQVNLVVKEALELLRASLPSTIEIRQDLQSGLVILADLTQIHQILMNLCTNAAHAMQKRGGILEVTITNVDIAAEDISSYPDLKPGPYLKLTVSDTGHGMHPEVLERIFDPFFTTKEKEEGTGMGLAVVHGIVKSHGGTVHCYSEPGKGSRFEVLLPVIDMRLNPKKTEKPLPEGTERILFVDDEQVLVEIGKQILESLGYEVTTRTSSIEALELFKVQADKFDLVITDMTMPNMTGEDLATELMQIRSDIPIILCTGFSAKIAEKKAMAMGIRAFILKPILKREIAETIRKVLDG